MDKLPVGALVQATVRHFLSNLRLFEMVAWPWLLLLVLWVLLAALLDLPRRSPAFHDHVVRGWDWLSGAVVAVAWHRAILLGEWPTRALPLIGRREIRYVGIGLLLMLIGLLPWVLVMVATAGAAAAGAHLVAIVLALAVSIATLILVLRLELALPAAAIDQPLDLRGTWQATRGCTWRLLAGTLLTALPPTFVAAALDFAGRADGSRGLGLFELAAALCHLLGAVLLAGFLSFAYRWLEERRSPRPLV